MALVYENNRGSLSVDQKGAFCSVVGNGIPSNQTLSGIVEEVGNNVQRNYGSISNQAIGKCNGDWYEWVLAIKAWNKRVTADRDLFAALLLPNKSSYEVSDLYVDRISSLVPDLRQKVRAATNVELITSNPDFAIIDTSQFDGLPDWFHEPINQVTESTIERLKDAYELFDGICEFDDLRGYIGAKRSMRPDRRLQMPHEGSLMKAIYSHIQTREWMMEPQGISYYAVSADLTDADRDALRTVATHSITTVDKLPEAAVDDAFIANTHQQTEDAFDVMLT